MKYKLVFGALYTIGYFILSVIPVNAEGTGPIIFVAPCFTWPLVLVALFFENRLATLLNRVFFVLLLLVHYFITTLIVLNAWEDQYPQIQKMMNWDETWLFYLIGAWYLAGQMLIWTSFFKTYWQRRDANGFA